MSAKDGYVKDSVETYSLFPRVLVSDVCKFTLQIILCLFFVLLLVLLCDTGCVHS